MKCHMDFSNDLIRLATLLWDDGIFLSTRELDDKNISLYIYNDEYYFIWYSCANELESIEKTDGEKARLVFGEYFNSRNHHP